MQRGDSSSAKLWDDYSHACTLLGAKVINMSVRTRTAGLSAKEWREFIGGRMRFIELDEQITQTGRDAGFVVDQPGSP